MKISGLSLVIAVLFLVPFARSGETDISLKNNAELARLGFIPQAKELNITEDKITLKAPFSIISDRPEESGYTDWLASELKRIFGWNEDQKSPAFRIEVRHQPLEHGPEAYKININKKGILLTVSGNESGYRAAGRLLSMLDGDFFRPGTESNTIECNAMRLYDWPDIPRRGLMLQMAFPGKNSAAQRMEIVRRSLDSMARLGYNFVVLEPGGCFESALFPSPPGAWTKNELRELVFYAAFRGLKAYPAINSIGHLERAPRIFILKNEKGRPIAMDITAPGFYQKYFAVIDEISDLFGNPEYFIIGTDESGEAFSKLSTLSARPPAELYSEFLNKISMYFSSKKIRPVIWHDMLLAPSEDGVANGQKTFSARQSLKKNIVIDYWSYDARANYRGLETLVKTGNEIWVSPWNSPSGIKRLTQEAAKLKIDSVMGTTWSGPEQSASAFVLTAEYSWNALRTDFNAAYSPGAAFNRFFNGRPERIPAALSELEFSGPSAKSGDLKTGTRVTAGGLSFPAERQICAYPSHLSILDGSEELRRAAAADAGAALYILDPGNKAAGLKLDGIDTIRKYRQVILYTPSYGKSTRTNTAGLEWIVRDGKIEKFAHGSIDGGNQPLNPGAAVISVHDFSGPSEWLRAEFTTGSPVLFASMPDKSQASSVKFDAEIPADSKIVALMLGVRFSQIGSNAPLGRIIARYPDASISEIRIDGDFPARHVPLPDGPLRIWIAAQDFNVPAASNPLTVFEWRNVQGKACPVSITLEIFPAGQKAGLSIVSAACDRASSPWYESIFFWEWF